jgi:hypothetical protein
LFAPPGLPHRGRSNGSMDESVLYKYYGSNQHWLLPRFRGGGLPYHAIPSSGKLLKRNGEPSFMSISAEKKATFWPYRKFGYCIPALIPYNMPVFDVLNRSYRYAVSSKPKEVP